MVTLRLAMGSAIYRNQNKNGLHGNIVGGSLGGGLANDHAAPGFVGFVDDLHGVLLILGLSREGKGVFGLAIGNLVDPTTTLAQFPIYFFWKDQT